MAAPEGREHRSRTSLCRRDQVTHLALTFSAFFPPCSTSAQAAASPRWMSPPRSCETQSGRAMVPYQHGRAWHGMAQHGWWCHSRAGGSRCLESCQLPQPHANPGQPVLTSAGNLHHLFSLLRESCPRGRGSSLRVLLQGRFSRRSRGQCCNGARICPTAAGQRAGASLWHPKTLTWSEGPGTLSLLAQGSKQEHLGAD